jgi:hypothetical protein
MHTVSVSADAPEHTQAAAAAVAVAEPCTAENIFYSTAAERVYSLASSQHPS